MMVLIGYTMLEFSSYYRKTGVNKKTYMGGGKGPDSKKLTKHHLLTQSIK